MRDSGTAVDHDGTSWAPARASTRPDVGTWRWFARLALVALGYYAGARVGLALSLINGTISPLWPPTGIAVAALILLGRSLWPAVFLAAFLANVVTSPPLVALVMATGNTLGPVVAVILLQKVGFRRQLDRQRDAWAIVFVGALASMTVSATIGSGVLALSGSVPRHAFAGAWWVWWTGDAMGVLMVAPFLLSLPLFRELPRWTSRQWLEALVILLAAAGVTSWVVHSPLHVFFLPFLFVAWAAWRLQLRGTAPVALAASLIVTWAATRSLPPFEGRSLMEQMFTLSAFNAILALTSFFLAAMVSERLRDARALAAVAAELEDRVRERTAELSETNARLREEIRERWQAQAQLSHEEARARREHEIAETLQRSLLPAEMPRVPGVSLAARYVPATGDVQVGVDWYDVIQLPEGLLGLTIGDVAGHGLPAASTMAQIRMALRAYAVKDPSPRTVMERLHHLVTELSMPDMVTVAYLLLDPMSRQVRFSSAGHPPALVVSHHGASYLGGVVAPPLGVSANAAFTEGALQLAVGETLLLYTDGLIERRGVSIQDGLDRLREKALDLRAHDLDGLCDELLLALVGEGPVADDVALLAVRPVSLAGLPLRLELPAEARVLVEVRTALRRWLRDSGVGQHVTDEVLVAVGEACANVVQHAYASRPGPLEIEAELADASLRVIVRDHGRWRPAAGLGGGWGLQLMRALMESVEVDHLQHGTEVRLRRAVTETDA